MSGSGLSTAAHATSVALDCADALREQGWDRVDTRPTFALSRTYVGQGTDLASRLSSLVPLAASAVLSATWGTDTIRLELRDDGQFTITESLHGDLRDTFSDDEMSTARDAFNGDVSAALRLEGEWRAEVNVDPARRLKGELPTTNWFVVEDSSGAASLISAVPWWELRSMIPDDRRTVIAVRTAPSDFMVSSERVTICRLSEVRDESASVIQGSTLDRRHVPALTPDPRSIHPTEVTATGIEALIRKALDEVTSAACWALMSTRTEVGGSEASLEYFGLQRQVWKLDKRGPQLDADEHAAVFSLWQRCNETLNPDRVLATRQVVSLFRETPWRHASDVDRASEPLFLALRSEATAEALRMHRDSRALALSVARQTAESTAALAKTAVERCLGVLLAIGGIIVAKSSDTLTDAQAADLRHLLGWFLIALAAWSALIEGRVVTLGTASFKNDLATFNELLSEADQQQILKMDGLKRARRQAVLTRVAVPLVYLGAAVAAFLVRG